MLVCLFGADGSGKTSIAKYVVARLCNCKRDVCVVWVRGSHTFASLLARLLSKFEVFRGECNPYYHICVPPKMKKLWMWIELTSIIPVVLKRFVIPKLLKRTVIAERSLLDFLVWLLTTLRYPNVMKSLCCKFILSLTFSLCDRAIYVRAEEEVLVSRRKGFSEERLISIQLSVYDSLARSLNTPCIDTSEKTVSESAKEALRLIGDVCG